MGVPYSKMQTIEGKASFRLSIARGLQKPPPLHQERLLRGLIPFYFILFHPSCIRMSPWGVSALSRGLHLFSFFFFCWKAKSLHHTMSAWVKVFNLQPSAAMHSSANPPGCLLVSQRSLLTFLVFGSGQKPNIVFSIRAGEKHDRCPWKQHLCRCF